MYHVILKKNQKFDIQPLHFSSFNTGRKKKIKKQLPDMEMFAAPAWNVYTVDKRVVTATSTLFCSHIWSPCSNYITDHSSASSESSHACWLIWNSLMFTFFVPKKNQNEKLCDSVIYVGMCLALFQFPVKEINCVSSETTRYEFHFFISILTFLTWL